MITTEHGHLLLIIAGFLALAQGIIGLMGAGKNWRAWMQITPALALVQFLAVGFSFVALLGAFMTSDFSLALVADNSHSTKPMLYKFAGTWGNHEGSMLMWVTILALFGAAVALYSQKMPPALRARVLAVQGLVGFAFYAFIILTSNPFWRLAVPPADGSGLNPILQDPGLAFHPPFLYLGYVGLSVTFSFAIAGLLDGRVDAAWARFVRPWTLAAWIFLTIGIALGSWWAYYELGWGGYWFWDPVENASLMPWLISVALLHSAIVVEKRDTLKSWTILLAIIGFSFSLIGTFIVRSGLLTSVHSFASDPTRGMFILGIILMTIIIGFGLFAWRAPKLTASGAFAPVSRESGIVINNLLLCVSCAVVFIGTMWPLVAEMLTGTKLSVGAPFFDASFTPFFIMLAILLPIGASISWKRGKLAPIIRLFAIIGSLALGLAIFVGLQQTSFGVLAPIAVWLFAWVTFGTLHEIYQRCATGGGANIFWSRLLGIRRSEWGKYIAHIGFGIMILGVGILRAYEFEDVRSISAPSTFEAAGFDISFDGVEIGKGPNYLYQRGEFTLSKNGKVIKLFPENRKFLVEGMPTTETAIAHHQLGDLYMVIREGQEEGKWSVYFYVKPLVNLLWIGALMMALGGALSLFDRRMRLGAVK